MHPKVKVVGVRFRYSKPLWFDPKDTEPQIGDRLIVGTERGTELGECVQAVFEVAEADLPAPLKPVLRVATEEDLAMVEELRVEEQEAMPTFREYIEKSEMDMKPADVEILFGREKMIFYFAAEERVDFRQLVRDLAAHYHTRIEMRQVGVRDEARMSGGLGHCGEVLCCVRLNGEFAPVSIKMAKDQGLPLNPTKISGVCGRLMCCLRYEAEAYKDFNRRAPKKGSIIDTPRGGGKVIEMDALRETVKLQFRNDDEDRPGDTMKVGIEHLCCGKQGGDTARSCPCAIAPDVFEMLEDAQQQGREASFAAAASDFGYKALSSTQGTEAAIDNGAREASEPVAKPVASGLSTGDSVDADADAGGGSDGRKRSSRRRRGGRRRGETKTPASQQEKKPQEKKPQRQVGQQLKQLKIETRIPRRRKSS